MGGAEAFDLLQECTQRILSQPIRGINLSYWVQRVLMRHSSFLFSQPVLQHALQPLQDAFQVRCATHQNLLRLRGRLVNLRQCGRTLMINQEMTKMAKAGGDADAPSAPLLEYVEGDEELA